MLLLYALAAKASGTARAAQPGTVLWTFDLGRRIVTSPAVSQDGTVYIASDIGFYAVTNHGISAATKWSFPVGLPGFTCSASVGQDGTVYVGDNGLSCTLHALNPNGSEQWSIPIQPRFQYLVLFCSTPALGFDGTVYFTAGDTLFAATPGGVVKWSYSLDTQSGAFALSPTIGSDGMIYVGSFVNHTLYCIRPDGSLKWSAELIAGPGGGIALANNGAAYVSASGTFYAFSSQGTSLWTAGASDIDGPVVVAENGNLLTTGFAQHTLFSFTASGAPTWNAFVSISKGLPSSAPAIDAAGNIWYCVSNSIVALNSQGQLIWTLFAGYDAQGFYYAATSPVIAPDGTLYAALNTTLYAISTGTNGPSNSPWPMFQQNARHTGKIEKPSLARLQKRSDANFHFELYAQVGQTQLVQVSTDLVTWGTLTDIPVTNLPMDVVDLTSSNSPSRFYRAVSR